MEKSEDDSYDPYIELELYLEQVKNEIALAFENLDTLSSKNCSNDSLKRHQDDNFLNNEFKETNHSQQLNKNVSTPIEKQLTEGPNLLKLEKHNIIPLQSFKKSNGILRNLIDVRKPSNENHRLQQSVRSLEGFHLDDSEDKDHFLSSCNLHRSLNSLQSAISGDLANRESGIEVSSSSMEKISCFTTRPKTHCINYYSINPKRLQHATTQTSPVEALFGNDPYNQMEVLSQYSEDDDDEVTHELDEVDNAKHNYFRSNSYPFYSSENGPKKVTSERVLDSTEFGSINSTENNKSNIFTESLKTRSTSAPIIMKITKNSRTFSNTNILRSSRSQSGKYIAEIEALEACNWLRAAGFPQYASMFQDNLFPIDLSTVAKDHPFLENDPLQSLYRRLVILNKCAKIRVDLQKKTPASSVDGESDDENCALSENWTFEPQIRRWSRVVEMGPIELNIRHIDSNKDSSSDSRESSPERSDLSAIELLGFSTLPLGLAAHPVGTEQGLPNKFKRTGSERLKDGAKALLKKVESIKTQRRKRHNQKAIFINEPGFLDLTQFNENFPASRPPNLKYSKSNPASPLPSSPVHGAPPQLQNSNFLSPMIFTKSKTKESPNINIKKFKDKRSGDDTSHCSDSSQESAGTSTSKASKVFTKKPSRVKRFLQRSQPDDPETLSDSECQVTKEKRKYAKDSSTTKDSGSGSTLAVPKPIRRGGSLNLGKDSKKFREGIQRKGFRSRSTVRSRKEDESSGTSAIQKEKVNMNRWHSFQKTERRQSVALTLLAEPPRRKSSISGVQLLAMSCGQLQVVRKLALVTLTGYMERYCPSHKSGWQHWELPKFIKKIKAPDYKDKKVFGVPILLTVQRTGQSLPLSIQGALKWLKLNAIECVGLFRKSGVKSRIAKLKWIVEMSDDDSLSIYEGQHSYDVADLVKQYFRDLPESILTAKLTDTFLAIFKHLPNDVQADALQSALLLLPDENRDVLYYLLDFLKHISEGSMYNQMTAHNLSVCLAPSIFQNTVYSQRSTSVSPRNKKITGMPNAKELSEAHASHECLAYMIQNYKSLFSISYDRFAKCSFNYMDESKAVSIDALWDGNWNAYVYECTKATIKEGRERSRGWVSVNSLESSIEISYKKVGDGHPLRLWRAVTEIEAGIDEIQHHIIKERHLWDHNLLRSRIVEQLNERSHVYQYVVGGLNITDYCVLRSLQTDLPKGACVIVETSVEHPDAYPLLGGVRGIILASRYLLEPCAGVRKTKILHLARVDTKGHTPEWYNNVYGHIISQNLCKIKSHFVQSPIGFPYLGPEITI